MTVKTNFLQGSSYNASDLVNEFGALFTDGMLSGGAVTQHSTPNLSVDVTALKCIKSGLFLNSDSIVNVAITANTSGYNRIDVIAADLDNQAIVAVTGTPSSSPTAPILTGNKIALAQVLVGNNVSVINTTNITDVRQNADLFSSEKYLNLNGYVKLPSGFMIEWGTYTTVSGSGSDSTSGSTYTKVVSGLALPKNFASVGLGVLVCTNQAVCWSAGVIVNTSTINLTCANQNSTVANNNVKLFYVAIGY